MSDTTTIMNGTMTVTMEDNMTDMTSEYRATLEDKVKDLESLHRLAEAQKERFRSEAIILASLLRSVTENYDVDEWQDLLSEQTDPAGTQYLLVDYDVADEDKFQREYLVDVTLPVTVTMTVIARDHATAEEQAYNNLECDGVDYYDPQYDFYNMEYYVREA
jgi:hypothetical protein